MSKADKFREAWLKMRGDPYMLGWESNPDGVPDSKYDVGDPAGSNPKWGDCSGDFWSALIYAGAYLNGHPITKADRHTADTWCHMGTPVNQPSEVGDAGFLRDASGHAYHMFAYIGNGQVGEMGYNHECRITTLAVENARHPVWRHYNFDLGVLTPPNPVQVPPPLPKPIVIPPTVHKGSRGIPVFQLQAALNKLGYKPALVVDGDCGPKTVTAIRWAQKAGHMFPSGVCGAQTWRAILVTVAKL